MMSKYTIVSFVRENVLSRTEGLRSRKILIESGLEGGEGGGGHDWEGRRWNGDQ